eukprot:scaffold3050_cov99-Isochrysis_galbana.AAC.5
MVAAAARTHPVEAERQRTPACAGSSSRRRMRSSVTTGAATTSRTGTSRRPAGGGWGGALAVGERQGRDRVGWGDGEARRRLGMDGDGSRGGGRGKAARRLGGGGKHGGGPGPEIQVRGGRAARLVKKRFACPRAKGTPAVPTRHALPRPAIARILVWPTVGLPRHPRQSVGRAGAVGGGCAQKIGAARRGSVPDRDGAVRVHGDDVPDAVVVHVEEGGAGGPGKHGEQALVGGRRVGGRGGLCVQAQPGDALLPARPAGRGQPGAPHPLVVVQQQHTRRVGLARRRGVCWRVQRHQCVREAVEIKVRQRQRRRPVARLGHHPAGRHAPLALEESQVRPARAEGCGRGRLEPALAQCR